MDERAKGRRLAWSTAIFSAATGLSRVLGLVREIVAANYFGARGPINAFTVAFQIPNLVRALVADAALSSAFVPVFSELLEKGEKARAWRVASTVFWLFLLVVGGLTALFILAAPVVMPPLTGAYDDLAVTLSQILFPIVVLLGLFGIVTGILNSYEQFTIPALTPVFWNLAIIIGLVIGVPRADTESGKLYVYAGSIVVGTVIQFLLPLPWLRGLDGRLRLALDSRDPAVKQVFKLMVPVMLGLGLINVNAVIGTFFASKLIDPTTRSDRDRQGVPHLHAAAGDVLGRRRDRALPVARAARDARRHAPASAAPSRRGLRQINFLLIPAAVVCAVLAEPIVRLLYQRGAFDPDQTHGRRRRARRLLARARLQRDDADAEPRASSACRRRGCRRWSRSANLVLNTALYAVVLPRRHLGDPARDLARQHRRRRRCSSSRCAAASAGSTCADDRPVVRARHGRLGGARASSRTASGAALDGALGRSFAAQLVSLGAALASAAPSTSPSCRALRVREMAALLSLRDRFRRA